MPKKVNPMPIDTAIRSPDLFMRMFAGMLGECCGDVGRMLRGCWGAAGGVVMGLLEGCWRVCCCLLVPGCVPTPPGATRNGLPAAPTSTPHGQNTTSAAKAVSSLVLPTITMSLRVFVFEVIFSSCGQTTTAQTTTGHFICRVNDRDSPA